MPLAWKYQIVERGYHVSGRIVNRKTAGFGISQPCCVPCNIIANLLSKRVDNRYVTGYYSRQWSLGIQAISKGVMSGEEGHLRLLDVVPRWAEEIHSALELEIPVDPERVCEYLAVEYRCRVMHPYIDGLYYRTSTGVPFVYVNSRFHVMGRQRFTAAHEIGHHLIAISGRLKGCRYIDSTRTAFSPIEAAANRLAANLLMPEKLVREFWADLSSNPRYRLQILEDRFQVTRSAMRIRVEELQLARSDRPRLIPGEIPHWQRF